MKNFLHLQVAVVGTPLLTLVSAVAVAVVPNQQVVLLVEAVLPAQVYRHTFRQQVEELAVHQEQPQPISLSDRAIIKCSQEEIRFLYAIGL